MNLLFFKGARDMLQKTGLSVEECLKIVEIEIADLGERIDDKGRRRD